MEQQSGGEGVASTGQSFRVQLIQTSTGAVQQVETPLFQLYDEPGVAQTLLNISQPESMNVDQGQMGDFVSVDDGQVSHDPEAQVKQELDTIGSASYHLMEQYSEKEREERIQVADDIRSQISELCNQLCDLGEESFLLSIRVDDGKDRHVGSVKGDHFCLLRPEVVQDFHNFCLGIEEDKRGGEDVDETQDTVDDSVLLDDDIQETLDNEQHELMDVETMTDEKSRKQTPALMTPKVIMVKKSADGQSTEVDHQYVTTIKTEPYPAEPVRDSVNKENKETTTNILFLCDICKNVFNDIKQLRQHKFDIHGESDYKCDKCARVFSLKKTYERHQMDAHVEGDEKHLCDSCVLTFQTAVELEEHIHTYHNTDMPMKCDICEQTFPDILRLMEHRKLHFDYACFCEKCWQGFFDHLELEAHTQSACRYKEALYKCHICGKKFTKLATISKHIDTHPVHAPHVCRMCGRGFDTEKELKYHKSGAHIVRPFKCEFCEKTFKKKDSLIEHRRLHIRVSNLPTRREHVMNASGNVSFVDVLEEEEDNEFMEKPEFECATCGIALKTQNLLDQHIHQHESAAEQYKCDCCPKIFFSMNLLNIHCRKEHKMILDQQDGSSLADLDKILVCEWEGCNKSFYDESKLRQHMKYHGQRADKIARGMSLPERSSATCEICGKVLRYKSYMKAHMLSHSKDHPYQCEMCGQAYPTAKRLEDHVRVHKGDKPFKCHVCDKCFTSKSLRNQHMLIHLGHKTYICEVCGKGFMSRKHFKDHMRIHAGEEPHKCETCGKDFIYYRSLVRHMQVHVDPRTRSKPYKCEYCNKEYTEVTGYKHHMRAVHTGETPFQCDICGESFHRNDKLKRHIKSRHNFVKGNKEIIVTARRQHQGGPIIVKENESQDDLLQIVEGSAVEGDQNELHVDVIQNETDGQQQVFLIGLGNDGNEATYLQETQVIEGPDGTRYIIAGSGEELQVIESSNLQQIQDGEVVEGGIIQQVHQVEQIHHDVTGTNDILVMNDGDEQTLSTLANMASEAQIANE